MIEANSSAEFIREMVTNFSARGLVRYFTLNFRGDLAAIILAFRYRNKIYSYLSALDPNYEILGFGRTLLYDAIRHCYQQGIEAWNFMRGDEHYKFSWGANRIPKLRLQIQRSAGEKVSSAQAAGT
jgi:CelD/BcsL family acetyltransferase involved in cellulose biosynthesis